MLRKLSHAVITVISLKGRATINDNETGMLYKLVEFSIRQVAFSVDFSMAFYQKPR